MTNHPNRSKRRYYCRCRRSPGDRWIYAAKDNPPWTFHTDDAKTFNLNDGRRFAETVKRGRPAWEVELEPLPFEGKRRARAEPQEPATVAKPSTTGELVDVWMRRAEGCDQTGNSGAAYAWMTAAKELREAIANA